MSLLEEIKELLISGDAPGVQEKVRTALGAGFSPATIMDDGLIAGMSIIGQRFKSGQIYVPEVLIAARAMHRGMDVVKPLVASAAEKNRGTVVLGTVKGDLHDIGKNLVAMLLEGAGFKVVDLGVDVPTEKFLAAVEEHQPDIVGLSALLTSTMMEMKNTVEVLKNRKNVKVMIGGAPVTWKFAEEIGADGYAPDGASAVDKVKELLAG